MTLRSERRRMGFKRKGLTERPTRMTVAAIVIPVVRENQHLKDEAPPRERTGIDPRIEIDREIEIEDDRPWTENEIGGEIEKGRETEIDWIGTAVVGE